MGLLSCKSCSLRDFPECERTDCAPRLWLVLWLQIIQSHGEARIAPDSPEEAVWLAFLDCERFASSSEFSWGEEAARRKKPSAEPYFIGDAREKGGGSSNQPHRTQARPALRPDDHMVVNRHFHVPAGFDEIARQADVLL